MKLTVSKKTLTKLLYAEIIYVLVLKLLTDILGFPTSISYGIDIINIFLTISLISAKNSKRILFSCRLKKLLLAVAVMYFICLLTALVNAVNPMLVLWSTRNVMRYYPLFLALVVWFREKDAEKLIRLLLWLQIPNLLITLIQFYVLDYRGDYLGGLFGHLQGCNAYTNIYLCIVVTLSIEEYLHKKTNIFILGLTVLSWMLIAGLAELKIAFLEIPLIVFAAILLNRPSLRNVIIIAFSAAGLVVGIRLILKYFPEWTKAFVSIGALIESGAATGGGYNISRLNAFSEISSKIFQNDPFSKVFGLGFGNCEYSAFDFLTSSFYIQHADLNYRWFAHQMWFLQCGYLGIAAFALPLIAAFTWIYKAKKKYRDAQGYGAFGLILIALLPVNFIYNASLITESGYIAYAALAIPFIYYKQIILAGKGHKFLQ